jgi:phosphatidylinositol-3-phosphatase
MRTLTLLAALVASLAVAAPAGAALPSPHHVFVIVLENENADTAFGSGSPAPYLAHTLTAQGAFLPNYYGIAHNSLPNYLAMISGQAPTLATQADCPLYADVLPGLPTADGQVIGQGCVYPAAVKTVADQLDAAGYRWRGYMEDMGDDPTRDNGTRCAHPVPGTPDGTQQATATDQYATRHDPFVYFRSIVDDAARCAADDVPLSRLTGDLASAASTPNLVFVTPDLCHDGHDANCADGGPGGLPAADAFLRTWVPRITGSPAYQHDGALVIVFDESATDSSACCGEQSAPNTPAAGGQSGGPGGGRTGAVILAPSIPGGTVITQAYNHYGLLRGIEDAFGLAHLGYAATTEGLWP